MKYTALVTDTYNNRRLYLTYDYPTKKEFIQELRSNGYKVSDKNVKPQRVYNYLLAHYNGNEPICRYLTVKDLDDMEAGKVSIYELEDKYFHKLMSLYERRIKKDFS